MKKTFRPRCSQLQTTHSASGSQFGRSIFSLKGFQWFLPVIGILIGLILLTITCLSNTLAIHQLAEQSPLGAFVTLMIVAGGIYTIIAFRCRQMSDSVALRNWIVLIALGLRLTMAIGVPILEDDHYRYLWDGALVAHGHNPYRHAPSNVHAGIYQDNDSSLAQLAEQSGIILKRVNYPWLRTIYPPVAQAAFGIAHSLSPWRLWTWRLVLTVFELTAFFILFRMGVPASGLLIYGWNPLLIKEVYNSVHVDALMLPFLLIAVIAVRRNRPITATAALGVATGIKLWPVLLMPMIWRRLLKRPPVLVASIVLFAVCLTGALLPLVFSGLNGASGLMAYGRFWEMNDALYTLVVWCVDGAVALLPFIQDWSALMPRVIVAAGVVGGAGWLAWRREMAVEQQFLMATTLLFILSPTQFPWYYSWLMPFLALHPHPALILYTALLPLYYLRPLMDLNGHTGVFDHGVVWIQHGPVIIWLVRDWIVRPLKAHPTSDAGIKAG